MTEKEIILYRKMIAAKYDGKKLKYWWLKKKYKRLKKKINKNKRR